MPGFSGRFQYLDEQDSRLAGGPCQLDISEGNCTVLPAGGEPLRFDLGDAEAASAGEWDLRLWMFDRRSLLLTHFAKAFGEMRDALMAEWRQRTLRCLMLEDLEELKRFEGFAATPPEEPARAEIRVFKSNIAVIPQVGAPLQWRLADVDAIEFEPARYRVALTSGRSRLELSRLAKKTDECHAALAAAHARLRQRTVGALAGAFGFLSADQTRRLAALMPEGRSALVSSLAAIHPKLPEALAARAVDEPLRPYFEALRARSVEGSLMAGFKFVSGEDAAGEPEGGDDFAPVGLESEDQTVFWFFFPLAAAGGGYSGDAAWEASTGGGRATYVFRAGAANQEAVEGGIAAITRGLALVNFRREPIYLPDESLATQPRYRRYLIGCRRLPELRSLRAAYRGRALHTGLEAWQQQLDAALR